MVGPSVRTPSSPPVRSVLDAHRFHRLTVARVVPETEDSASFVLSVPADLADLFVYRPGQFCTVRVTIDGCEHLRSYSMSSTPGIDPDLTVTVKRVPGGLVSNWLLDHVRAGDDLWVNKPSGSFCLVEGSTRPLVALCGGSGVTPVVSLAKAALAASDRPVHVLYANRHAASVIFEELWQRLAERYPDRLRVVHHLDSQAGIIDEDTVRRFAEPVADGECYVCGPAPFMDLVERTLGSLGVPPDRIVIERFTTGDGTALLDGTAGSAEPAPPVAGAPAAPVGPSADPADAGPAAGTVTIVLKGRATTAPFRPGDTVLETARRAGLNPPFSCEAGNCATCMAIVRSGSVTMRVNDALTDDEVAEGWVLTCQAVPDAPGLVIEYEAL